MRERGDGEEREQGKAELCRAWQAISRKSLASQFAGGTGPSDPTDVVSFVTVLPTLQGA